ncbi:MAG: HEAT repeat domain-containing protein, partial [Myxococcales bacterium]|nr:HEAT repeat domain-containing protein [Myxococcales bacterium]
PAVEVRRTAAAAVGDMKLYRAAGKLVALLDDADPGVQRAAVRALGQIRQRAALATLVDRYEQTVADYHGADLRQDLVVAIGRIGGRDSLRVLVDATSDPDLKVRLAAVEALR